MRRGVPDVRVGSLLIVLVGLAGGLAGHALRLPAGPLLGALAAVAVLRLWALPGIALAPSVRSLGRVLVGTTIGSTVSLAVLVSMGRTVVLALVLSATLILVGAGLAFGMVRLGGMDPTTAVIAASPGGMPEMVGLADELGADVDLVMGFHTLRKFASLLAVLGTATLLGWLS